MHSKRVCILGASGSIGSHLVRALLESGYQVTAVVRSLASAARIARYDINMQHVDLFKISTEQLAKIFNGHDAIVDCTYAKDADCHASIAASSALAKLICSAGKQAGIAKIIHYGSLSVYPQSTGVVAETTSCSMQGEAYADGKLAAEQIFLQQSGDGTKITVLQLPVVIGPFMTWTSSTIGQMSKQLWSIPDDITGTCSPIFISDVLRATISVIEHNDSAGEIGGERILLKGIQSMSWNEFYAAHAALSTELSLVQRPRKEIEDLLQAESKSRQPWQQFLQKFGADGDFRQLILAQWGIRVIYRGIQRFRGQHGIDRIKSRLAVETRDATPLSQKIIDRNSLAKLDSMPAIASDKAQRMLAFTPVTAFEAGLQQCREWLEWARLL